MPAKLISVIGPPAVGKTTLAEHLAADLPADLICEDWAGNPFLAESYAGDERARLPGELYFLISRAGQLLRLSWPGDGLRVSDYGFCQDRIFAGVRLNGRDMELYDRLAARLEPLVCPPDVLVYLDAGERTLRERIARRGRDFERVMDGAFLAAMRRAYRAAAAGAACPVLRVDCDAVDVGGAAARADLVRRVRESL